MHHLSPTIVLGSGGGPHGWTAVGRAPPRCPVAVRRAVSLFQSTTLPAPGNATAPPLSPSSGGACRRTSTHRTFWHHMTLWGYTAVVLSPAVRLCIRSSGRAVSAAMPQHPGAQAAGGAARRPAPPRCCCLWCSGRCGWPGCRCYALYMLSAETALTRYRTCMMCVVSGETDFE